MQFSSAFLFGAAAMFTLASAKPVAALVSDAAQAYHLPVRDIVKMADLSITSPCVRRNPRNRPKKRPLPSELWLAPFLDVQRKSSYKWCL